MTAIYSTVGGTGHRDLTADVHDWAAREAYRLACKLRDEHGCTTIVSGLALGWDTIWALAALSAGLDLWVHIPYMSQPDRWGREHQQTWRWLREHAARETVYGPDPTTKSESVHLLHARNVGMVDVSQAMTCLWDPTQRTGGTWHAVRLITRRDLPAIHLNPVTRTVRFGLPSFGRKAA